MLIKPTIPPKFAVLIYRPKAKVILLHWAKK